MTPYKIKELWTVQQCEDERPDAVVTGIRTITREAFRKLPDEHVQSLAIHGFCEGRRDRGLAALMAKQVRNSAARAVRIAAEESTVNSKKIESKPSEKTAEKALGGVSSRRLAEDCRGVDISDYSDVSEQSMDFFVALAGADVDRRGGRCFPRDGKGVG